MLPNEFFSAVFPCHRQVKHSQWIVKKWRFVLLYFPWKRFGGARIKVEMSFVESNMHDNYAENFR